MGRRSENNENARDRKPEEIRNRPPHIPEEESAISVRVKLDMQDQDLVRDQPGTPKGQEMAEMKNEVSGNLQSGDRSISNEGGGDVEIPHRYGNAYFTHGRNATCI